MTIGHSSVSWAPSNCGWRVGSAAEAECGAAGSRVEIGSPHAVHGGRGSCHRTEAKCLLVKVSPPSYSKAAAPALLSFSNCEIATINCDMTKGFSIMILLGTP